MTEEEARDAVRIIVGNRAISRLELLASSIIAENSRQNLIATSTIDTMWSRHILDSIQLVQWAAADDGIWVDIGTGGGFPGLAIAVATGRTITLVEPRRQRASFLKEMVTEFGLSNVSVVQTRVERLDVCEATILSARAVASIATLFEAAIQCSTPATRWLLPRGTGWQTDIGRAKVAWKGVFHVEQSLSDPSSRVVVATGVARR